MLCVRGDGDCDCVGGGCDDDIDIDIDVDIEMVADISEFAEFAVSDLLPFSSFSRSPFSDWLALEFWFLFFFGRRGPLRRAFRRFPSSLFRF